MSLDIYSKVNNSRKKRFTKKEPEDRTEWEEREVNIYQSAEDVEEDCMVSLSQGEDQQVHSPSADNKSPTRSAKLCKMVLWIFMLGVIITLAIYFPLEIIKVKKSNSHLQAKLLGKWCPEGWTRFGCSCYRKFNETKSGTESRRHCQERGADLVVIDSPDEQEFVKELNENGESWIGLKSTWIKDTRMYEWRWVDGSPLTETFWAAGWPRKGGIGEYATCCNDEGKWTHRVSNHYSNDNHTSWICEK